MAAIVVTVSLNRQNHRPRRKEQIVFPTWTKFRTEAVQKHRNYRGCSWVFSSDTIFTTSNGERFTGSQLQNGIDELGSKISFSSFSQDIIYDND